MTLLELVSWVCTMPTSESRVAADLSHTLATLRNLVSALLGMAEVTKVTHPPTHSSRPDRDPARLAAS